MSTTLDPKENNHLLRLRVAQLEAQIAAQGLEPEPEVPAALHALTPQELALYRLLDHAKGRFLSRAELDRALPARDHAADRDYGVVSVIVCRVRTKLGADVILNERGRGYRLGRAVA